MDDAPATIEGAALLADSAALQWYEAVAVVLQIAGAVRQARAGVVPDLSHVRLWANGLVEILPGSPPTTDLVTPLAASLRLLLERAPGPFELGQFVNEAAEGRFPGHDVDRFVISLNYYERPGRQLVLQNLVERVAPIEAEARAAVELKRLEARAREGALAPAAATKKEVPSANQRRRKLLIAALAVIVLALGASGLAWLRFRPALSAAGSSVRSVVSHATSGIAQAFNTAADRLFSPAQQPAPVGDAAPPAPRPAPRARAPKPKPLEVLDPQVTPAGRAVDLPLLPTLVLPSAVLTPPNEILLEAPPLAAVTESMVDTDRVYTAVDKDVMPPVPLQPLLGRPTSDGAGVPGDMEVLVGPTGIVERVTLLVPNAYQDRFMIYAMKARRFKPAVAGGRPVRYLLRIRTAF